MSRSSHPVQVATSAPLLRVVLLSVLLIAAFAGVLVTSSVQIGWVVLGVAVVVGPVAVMVEGRSQSRTERTQRTAVDETRARWELAA